jgi:hypothetical protein
VWLTSVLALALLGPASAQPRARAPIAESPELAILQAPVIVTVGGAAQLVYEMHITNLGRAAIALTRIEVIDAGGNTALGELGDAKLAAALAQPGAAVAAAPADTPHAGPRPPVALENASGNHVVLDLGAGRFAVYEHLKPGSVRVKPGARVRRGDVIAALGNTGSSSGGPHLHLHVSNANATLAAEGLPYVFDAFEVLGEYRFASGKTPAAVMPSARSGKLRGELPAPLAVVRL